MPEKEEGSERRAQVVDQLGELYYKVLRNINGTKAKGDVSLISQDMTHDLAAVLCCSLEHGHMTMTPRYTPANEVSYIVRLQGLSRMHYEKLPQELKDLLGSKHWLFGGKQRAKVVFDLDADNLTMHMKAIRPMNSDVIGGGYAAARDPRIQEVTIDPNYNDDLEAIEVHGSIMSKAWWHRPLASALRKKWAGMPETAIVDARVSSPK